MRSIERFNPATPRSLWIRRITSLFVASVMTASISIASGDDQEPTAVASTFSGRIENADGSPVATAKVYLRPTTGRSVILPTRPAETTTDAQGEFTFSDLDNGGYRLWAETESGTTLTKKLDGLKLKVSSAGAKTESDIVLTLHPGCGYDVTIVDAETKQPLEEATVEFGWTDIARSYLTDETGLAKIRNLGVDDWYFVVRADGYGTQFKRTSEQKLGSVLPLRFEMSLGGELHGTVLDQTGTPVAGARVYCSSDELSMSPNYARVDTADDGTFRITGLPLTTMLRVSISKTGYEHQMDRLTVSNTTGPERHEFRMKKIPYGGDVLLTVVDEDDYPLPDAEVSNGGRSSSQKRGGRTGEDGKCLLENVYTMYRNREQAEIVVRAKGYQTQAVRVAVGPQGDPSQHTVTMEPGQTLYGKLLTPDLDPAAGVRVYYDHGENGGSLGGRVNTDKDGRFEIDGLGKTTVLTVYSPKGYAPIRKREIAVGDEELAIVLETAGVIRLRAVDSETGKRIPEFNVKLGFCTERKPDDPSPGGISSQLINPGVNVQGTAREYRLDNQVVGVPYKVIVSADGYEPQTLSRVVTVSGPEAVLEDVSLTPIDPDNYQTVAGQLIDAQGEPIRGAAVRLVVGNAIPHSQFDPNRRRTAMTGWRFYHWDLLKRDDLENRDQCLQYLKTVSDSEGRFTFSGVSKKAPWVELFYTGKDLMSQRYSNLREREDGELSNLVLQAEEPAELTVAVTSFDPQDIGAIRLEADNYVSGPNTVDLAYSNESQELEPGQTMLVFRNLPSGHYRVSVTAKPIESRRDGSRTYMIKSLKSENVTIDAGEKASVEF